MSTCRVCGCTDFDACETAAGPCYWAEPDLCSACVGVVRVEIPNSGSRIENGSPLLTEEVARALVEERVYFCLPGDDALKLLATLQLACRHPNFSGLTRHWVDEFARGLAERLARVGPTVAAICDAGFRPECDVTREEFEEISQKETLKL